MVLTGMLEVCGIGFILPLISILSVENIRDAHPFVIHFHALLGYPEKTDFIITSFAMVILLFLIKNSLLIFFFWCQTKFVVGVNRRISHYLYEGYISQSYSFHLNKNSSELIRNTTSEVSQFSYNVLMPLFALTAEVLVLTLIFAFLCCLEPLGTLLISGILLSCASCFFFALKNRLTSWGKSRQLHEGLRLLHLQQGLGAIKEVKIFGCEAFFGKAYGTSNTQVAKEWTKQIFFNQVPRFGVELIAVSGLLCFAIVLVLMGNESFAIISTLGLFAAAAFRLIPSSNRILASVQAIRFGLPTLDLISSESKEMTKQSGDEANRVPLIRGLESKICVKDLAFKHHEAEQRIISELSFEIKKGESVGIVGSSGVGKSTLVDLLLGLHNPLEGKILIDGIDIASDIWGWRSQIGYVPQSVFISDSSLRENIAFGLPKDSIDDEQVWKVLNDARLDEFVRSLEGGLDTIIGERGARISGGQCQRIGIARALYREPSILMFDEATSALDNNTEKEFIETIKSFSKSRTILIIAHRLSTIKYCHHILKLENNCSYKYEVITK
jgi:ATP-binding cassette, subfamily B, bacterial PglK